MKKYNSYNILILSILASFLILLNSCSSRGKIWDPADAREFPAEPEKRVQKNLEEGRGFRIMDLNKKEGGGSFEFATSNALWRATLDILEFAPLSNVDYGGGVIITDWYSSENNLDQSIKISIQFLSDEIRADGLIVKVYQKNCVSISNCAVKLIETDLNQEIKLAILRKAAQIKTIDIKKNKKKVVIPKNSKDRKKKKSE